MTADERATAFWARVDKRGQDECWPYTGAITATGYGNVGWQGKNYNASRVAFFLTHGEWPDHACHTCDNKPCCNPAHIYNGNKSTNQLDFHARDPRAALVVERAKTMVLARWSRQ